LAEGAGNATPTSSCRGVDLPTPSDTPGTGKSHPLLQIAVLIILIPLTWLAVTTIVLAACQAGAAADRPAEADALRSHLRRPVD